MRLHAEEQKSEDEAENFDIVSKEKKLSSKDKLTQEKNQQLMKEIKYLADDCNLPLC